MFAIPLHWATLIGGIILGWVSMFVAASISLGLKRRKAAERLAEGEAKQASAQE